MKTPRSQVGVRAAAALASLLTALGCEVRHLDAVAPDACVVDPTGDGCPALVWPNAASKRNSDPWLIAHHDQLVRLEPKVLVLDFVNDRTVDQIRAVAETQIALLARGSRYHGYRTPNAAPFLSYQLAGVVDLTDHLPPGSSNGGHRSSSLLPVTSDGAFDVTALFTRDFAERVGVSSPDDPGRHLGVCELFERGLVNELWLSVGESGERAPPLSLERKQAYDSALRPLAGQFEECSGGGGCLDATCAVTVRLAHLSPDRGPGCDLQVRGWNLASMRKAVPYLAEEALAFFNADFDTRFGLEVAGWPQLCDRAGHVCIDYPTPTSASGTNPDGTPFLLDPFDQGCGTSEFPPNARARWDYASALPVNSRCEHYGLRDGAPGPDGVARDATELYTADKVANGNAQYPDCGGGWQLYWRQSLPGLANGGWDSHGRPMKNWWPFLFY